MEKYRILCVDDDITILNTLEDILTGAGFDVSLAKSGPQAIKLLERGIMSSLILLDVDMPEMDGYTAFEKIRQVKGCDCIPIIFLTGMDSPDFEIKGLEIGAADYISKPFLKSVLIARINNHIRRANSSPQNSGHSYNQEAMRLLGKELNESERMIAGYIAEGLTNQEIAERTNYSYNYVKKMSSSILSKLNLTRRAEIRKLMRS